MPGAQEDNTNSSASHMALNDPEQVNQGIPQIFWCSALWNQAAHNYIL